MIFQKKTDKLKENEITIHDVTSALETQSHVVVDVRELDEWNDAHIDGAIHIPLGDLVARANEIPADKPIYTVCRSGGRSLVAIEHLNHVGKIGALSMAGGMIAWTGAGKPIAN